MLPRFSIVQLSAVPLLNGNNFLYNIMQTEQ